MLVHLASISINLDYVYLIKWGVTEDCDGNQIKPSAALYLNIEKGKKEISGVASTYWDRVPEIIYIDEFSDNGRLLTQQLSVDFLQKKVEP